MSNLLNNPLITSLANWAWATDPNPEVTPTTCLDSLPIISKSCLTCLITKGIGVGMIEATVANPFMVIRNNYNKKLENGEKFKIKPFLKT